MAQAPKRFDDVEVPFVFIPDGADATSAPLPSSDPVRLRARLVPAPRQPPRPHAPEPDRRPDHRPPARSP